MPDPTNPVRLAGSPALGEPALGTQPVAVVERSPTGLALIPQVLVKIITVLVALAAVGMTVFGMLLPAPWAATGLAVCTSIVGLGAAFGIASPGARAAGTAGVQAVTVAPQK